MAASFSSYKILSDASAEYDRAVADVDTTRWVRSLIPIAATVVLLTQCLCKIKVVIGSVLLLVLILMLLSVWSIRYACRDTSKMICGAELRPSNPKYKTFLKIYRPWLPTGTSFWKLQEMFQ